MDLIADVCNYGAVKVYNIEMQKRSTLGYSGYSEHEINIDCFFVFFY